MAIDAGQGYVDILPRVNSAAFAAATQKGLAPVATAANTQAAVVGKSFGQKMMSSLGGALRSFGSFAAVGLGVAAVGAVGRLTLQFEDAFTRINAISNASAEQIARWREEVFALGRETAVAPQELADGLYFLASAGLEANQIFPALEAGAKASAIGLGEMADLTRITAQVLNAFPEAGLKAADAMDVLVAAVREGTAEPDEFAEAMGRLLPIATKAGVEFDQLAASLSVLSNIGLDVPEGVTGIRQVLNLIVSPGKQATDTMNELGIASQQLRDILREGGIIEVLRFLNERVGENDAAFRKLLPNIRAMTAAFGLTEQEARKVDGIFRRVADSEGDLDKALAETQAGPGFKFRRFLEALTEIAIRSGQALKPIATTLLEISTVVLGPISAALGVLTNFAGVFSGMAVALAGWVSAWVALKFLPGLLFGIAKGLAAIGLIRAPLALAGWADALAKLSVGASLLKGGLVLGALTAGIISFGNAIAASDRANVKKWTDEVRRFGRGSREAADEVALLQARTRAQTLGGPPRPGAISRATEEQIRRNIALLNQELDAEHEAAEIRRLSVGEFTREIDRMGPRLGADARRLAAVLGQPWQEFAPRLRQGLAAGREDLKKWAEFQEKLMGDIANSWQKFHDEVAGNLDFVGGAFADMATEAAQAQQELAEGTDATGEALRELREQANLTPGELIQGMREALTELRDFGRNLVQIAEIPRGGEALANWVQGLGEMGVVAAAAIADAPRNQQRALAELATEGATVADRFATKLTNKIVGPLNAIKDLLQTIAENFGLIEPEANVKGDAATKLPLIQNRLFEIDGYVATATVNVHRAITEDVASTEARESTSSHFGSRLGIPEATGGVIPGARGLVTRRPTLLVGEGGYSTQFGKGSEAVMPLDERMLARIGSAIGGYIELPAIVVKVGEEELARTVTRGQRRRRQLVGA